jgi:hypothetical protein
LRVRRRSALAILVVLTLAAGIAMSQPKVRMGSAIPGPPRPPRGERLFPDWGIFDDPLNSPFHNFLAQRLLGDLPSERYAQLVVTSGIEHAMLIEAANDCYSPNGHTRIFYSTARSSISSAFSAKIQAIPQEQRTMANQQKVLATLSIPIDVMTAPIDCASAATLGRVWTATMRAARYDDVPRDGPNCSIGCDGTLYHFTAPATIHDWMSGFTWSPDAQTPAGRMVQIGRALIDYVKAPIPDRGKLKSDIMTQATGLLADLHPVDAGAAKIAP